MGLIYISSTYRDLIDYRKAVCEAVRRVEHQPIGMEDYQAGEKPPLDRCLQDVRRCHAYIGLIGWRYGYEPRGYTKSITCLEYEEAGKCNIPRLMFVTPEQNWPQSKRDKDIKSITEFRKLIQTNHTVNTFENLFDLKYKVAATLKGQLGEGVMIPSLLPYKCDRNEQYEDIYGNELLSSKSQENERTLFVNPIIYLIHGCQSQALNKFLQCLREEAASFLSVPKNEAISWKEIPWPTERSLEAFRAAFIRRAGKVLGTNLSSGNVIAEKVNDHDEPLIIHTRVYIDEWFSESSLALRAFVEFWQQLPINPRRYPLIVFITVDYREAHTFLKKLKVKHRNKLVRQTLVDLDLQFASKKSVSLVRELEDIKRYHAEEWGESKVVQSLLNKTDLQDDIGTIFKARNAMPMRPLAKQLLTILRQKTS